MKYKHIILMVSVLCAFLGFAVLANMQTRPISLKLTVESAKRNYKLGEPVELSFALINNSDKEVPLSCFGIGTGEVQLFISRDKKEFLEYKNPEWGTVDAVCHNVLKPTDKIEIPSVKILWNYKADVSHLNETAAKEYTKGYLVNDYAFPEAGTYFVKASAFNSGITSEPIQIKIKEPVGEDLEVWNKIKNRGDIAYFIQNGYVQIPDYQPEEKEKFQKEIEQLLVDYPNSFYAAFLRSNLDKFRTFEIKRREFRERLINHKQ